MTTCCTVPLNSLSIILSSDIAVKTSVCFALDDIPCCTCYTGKSSFEANIEADSNDVTEHPHDDKPRPYVCMVCEKRFTTKGHLNVHKLKHTGGTLCCCSQCGKSFANQYQLRDHMYVHSSKHKCTECGKCFRSSGKLAVHGRIHSGEKPFECTVCSKRFTTSRHLVVHSRIHSGEKPYKCHLCDKAFSESGHINSHMRVHTGDKPYKCHECDKAFSQSSHLNTHMRVHTGDKPYKCSLCNKSFTTSSHLHSHSHHVHMNRRPHYCRYCGKLFKSSSNLKCHVHVHTGAKPYSCIYRHCSDRFTHAGQLKTHLLKSHNEGTWFTCNICQKKYICSATLKVHLLRHGGVKPYVCCECPKSFCTAAELRSHQHVHSDYKQFCCFLCLKNFKQKSYVKKHFKKCSSVNMTSDDQLFNCL